MNKLPTPANSGAGASTDNIEHFDPWTAVQYSKDRHDELVAPLLRAIEAIPSVVRDEKGKVKLDEPTIVDLMGSYPITVVRFDGGISLRLQLQDDGGKPYVVGKLMKTAPWIPERGLGVESINLEPLYPRELKRLPELVAKLERTEVPYLLDSVP